MSESPNNSEFDAIVVGAGPNGLAAAIAMAKAGCSVQVLEASQSPGGGARSAELTLPGFVHDVCSAIHPLAVASPFFRSLDLAQYGLEWIEPEIPLAHPMDDGSSAILYRSLDDTCAALGVDSRPYRSLMAPLVTGWHTTDTALLGPMLRLPRHPFELARFGVPGIVPATTLARTIFKSAPARGLFAGLAAHSVLPLTAPGSSAFALVLAIIAHIHGWPIPRGGAGQITAALTMHLKSLGGTIVTDSPVSDLRELPPAKAVLLDLSPRQIARIGSGSLPQSYLHRLRRYRYGPGIFKVDWALSGPIPWTSPDCARAGTVHLGTTLDEIARSEHDPWIGAYTDRPFVILAQQSLFDNTRAPEGKHTVWAYCHVPNASSADMTSRIEAQIERFAPGFCDLVLDRHSMGTAALESYNANYVGGDIAGGANSLDQLFTRPFPQDSPYRLHAPGLYICSSSTPPGGGVHGMCGYWAARTVLLDMGIRIPPI